MRDFEADERVQEGHLVPEELQELVGITNVLPRGHMRLDLHALAEGIQSFLSLGAPELRQAALHRVRGILIAITEPGLKVRDAKDALKGCVNPTTSALIAKSEHSVVSRERSL